MNESLQAEVREEVEALHRFFVDWFSGRVAKSGDVFRTQFTDRFDPRCVLIPPAGTALDLGTLAEDIRARHGSNPEFRIQIRNVLLRAVWDEGVLATYEEWQRNALTSTPPDNGRIATVQFGRGDRLRWRHVHETWLPAELMRADPYNF